MIPITLSLLALAALGAAQNTTVSLFLPLDQQSLVGSVVGADSTATTYVVDCASGDGSAASTGMDKKKRQAAAMTTAMPSASPTGNLLDSGDECGLISAVTVTQGPSTLVWTLSLYDNDGMETISCVLSGTTKAVCGASATGLDITFNITAPATATLTGTELPSLLPVVITAGADKLSGSAGTMTGTSTMAGSSAGTKTTGTASAASKGSGTGTTTGTGTGTATAASSTGGAVMGFEPAVGMGVAGAVAVGLGAILL